MIRVLHVVPDMNSGGIENYIMNMYRHMDHDSIQFDFLVHHEARGIFDDEIEAYGGRIRRLPVLDNKNLLVYKRDLSRLFKENSYPIVHGHAASLAFLYLGAAEKAGVPVRIAHSHGTSYLRTPKGYAKRALFKLAKTHANVRFACSTEAGNYLFGVGSDFVVTKNAIESARFSYSEDKRARIRESLDLPREAFVIGHVGRFNLQKNHAFLIDVFRALRNHRDDAYLLLVGDGELRDAIKSKVASLSLGENVLFQTVTDEPEAFYSAMDCFVLPSLFEGLPLVGIEAQCSGLPCFFSDSITREASITDNVEYLSLDIGSEKWAERILSIARTSERLRYANSAIRNGFDALENTRLMSCFYETAAIEGVAAVDCLLD